MDAAQLYLKLQESGERLIVALADEREANVFSAGNSSYANWRHHLGTARHEVERAAECYAIALRTFRVAMLSELAPSELATPPGRGRGAKHRERAVAVSAARGKGGGQANGNARKDAAAEGFPVSSRLSKIQ
jgi:hypothetical protein